MNLPEPSAMDTISVSRNRLVLVVYTATIFVSALLLFSVQPLFTKMVLPRLGGSPAVWSVAMVFFQSLLLGGYAYAHYLMQARNRVIPVVVHLVLLAIAMLTLPLSISSGWGDPPTSGYAIWLLYGLSVGNVPLIVVDVAGLLCGGATLAVALALRGSLLHPATWLSCRVG